MPLQQAPCSEVRGGLHLFLPQKLMGSSFLLHVFPDPAISVVFFFWCNFSSFCSNHSLVCLHYSSLPSPTSQGKHAHLDVLEKAYERQCIRTESMLDLQKPEFPTLMEEGDSKLVV